MCGIKKCTVLINICKESAHLKKLFKAVALITFFSVLTRLGGFLFRIYLSRTIGAEALGVYQVALSVFVVLLTFVASGIPLIISRSTAKFNALKDTQSEKSLVSGALIFAVAVSVVLCAVVLGGIAIFNKGWFGLSLLDERLSQIIIILLPAVVLTAIFATFRGWLWGKNNFLAVCFTEFIEQVARIVICFVLLSTAFMSLDGASNAALSLTLSTVVSAIVIVVWFFATGGRLGKPKSVYQNLIKPSTPITTVRILTSLVQPVIAFIIPLRLVAAGYTSGQAMSMFGIAIGMTMPLLFIPSALIGSLSMALIPDLSSSVTKQDNKTVNTSINSALIFTMFFSSLFVPLFMGAGPQIGMFFYDNLQSGNLLAYSAWFMIPFGITSITASILNAIGLELKSMKNYIIGAICMLICIWFLPKYIGINALVWGMGICMVISGILNLAMIKKHTKTSLNFAKPFWLMIAFIVPVTAITSFITNIMSAFFNLFFTLAISCSIGAICYLLLCVVFGVVNLDAIFVSVGQTIKNKKLKFAKNKKHFKIGFSFFKIKKKKKVKVYPNIARV